MSVANQKILTIKKDECVWPFLQVQESDWVRASKDLTFSAFKVYLYLVQNQNNFQLEYSPQAIENMGLMSKGTATKVRQELEQKGYIINNIFYARPPYVVDEQTKKREQW